MTGPAGPGRHVAFLESNLTGSGYAAVAAARRWGHRVTFLTRDLGTYLAPGHERLDLTTVDEVVTCETNDVAAVVDAVRRLPRPVDALVAVGEWHTLPGAEAAAVLGLPGPSPEGVRTARDKSRTRAACRSAGVPVPAFARVTEPADVPGLALRYPCVVKPLDDAGSNGVRLCATPAEAAEHVGRVLAVTHNERGQPRARAALVEEYVDGPEVSVEVLVHRGTACVVAVTAKQLGALPHFVETGHHVPATTDDALAARCGDVAVRALAAVGLDLGVAHVELRLASDGPYLIEVNCRPAGGRITQLVELATGVDLSAELVAMHLGTWRAPRVHRRTAAAIAFVPAVQGRVVAVHGEPAARAGPGVVDVALYVGPGDVSGPLDGPTARHGHVVARGPDGPEALRRAREAAGRVRVEVAPVPERHETGTGALVR